MSTTPILTPPPPPPEETGDGPIDGPGTPPTKPKDGNPPPQGG